MNRAHIYATRPVLTLALTVAGVALVCVQKYIQYYTRITTISHTIDSRLSASSIQDIELYIASMEKPVDVYTMQQLKDKFACIQTITCHHRIPRTQHLHIKAHDPCMLINNTMLMVPNGALVAADYYAAYAYKNLYKISMDPTYMTDGMLPADVYTSIRTIADDLFDRFNISYHAKHTLLLHDKQYPHTTVLCDTQQQIPSTIAAFSEKIGQRAPNARIKKKKHTIIDCRFADQIIVYDDMRGYDHDKGVG